MFARNQNYCVRTTSHQLESPSLKSLQLTNDGESVVSRELFSTWWECELVQPQWRTVCRFLKDLKTELTYDAPIPLLAIYLTKL